MRLLAISPGRGEDLQDWLAALAAGGVHDVLLREPALAALQLEAYARQALDHGMFPWLHTKNPHAGTLAAQLHCGAHHPAGAHGHGAWGASCHTVEELDRAFAGGASYALFSPVWGSTSKSNGPGIGLAAFQRAAGGRRVLALSGVTPGRARAAAAVGVFGVAVLGDLDRPPQDLPHHLREYAPIAPLPRSS